MWLYEFKFQMVSEYSTLVKFQSGTRKFVLLTLTVKSFLRKDVCLTFYRFLFLGHSHNDMIPHTYIQYIQRILSHLRLQYVQVYYLVEL